MNVYSLASEGSGFEKLAGNRGAVHRTNVRKLARRILRDRFPLRLPSRAGVAKDQHRIVACGGAHNELTHD